MNYSFMSFSTPELTLQEIFTTATQYGYAAIEPRLAAGHKHGIETTLDTAARIAVKAEIDASDIKVCCLATSCCYANPTDRQQWLERTDAVIDLAGDIGCERIRVFGGLLGENISRDQGFELVIEALKSAAKHAAERKVVVCIETHDDWCNPEHLAEIMRRVDHSNIMINWDIMHPVRSCGVDIDTAFNIVKPWIAHIHVHDGVDLPDGGIQFKAIGEGVIDHKRAIELISSIDYQGYISGEWINWTDDYTIHLPREIAAMKSFEL